MALYDFGFDALQRFGKLKLSTYKIYSVNLKINSFDMKRLIFFIAISFSFMACSQSKLASKNNDSPIKYSILYQSEYGGSGEEKTEIFTDSSDFDKMWNSTINTGETPEVDFTKQTVAVKHFQSKNSGGTTYQITEAKQTERNIKIYYSASTPEEIVTTAITNPLLILVLDTKNPEIEFILEK